MRGGENFFIMLRAKRRGRKEGGGKGGKEGRKATWTKEIESEHFLYGRKGGKEGGWEGGREGGREDF